MKLSSNLWDRLQQFLIVREKHSPKAGSIQADKARFKGLCEYFTDKEFNLENFDIFVASKLAKGNANSTVNNFIKMAKTVERMLGLNEIQDYSYFPETSTEIVDLLTSDEIVKLAELEVPYSKMGDKINQRQKALIMLLGTTGCRINEALELRYTDIHEDPYTVYFRDTKNHHDRRVPIGEDIYKMLVGIPQESEKVFVSGRGGYLQHQQINNDLKRRAKMLGIEKRMYCHLFRHTFITTMLELGASDSDVMRIVGHERHETLMKYKHSMIGHYVEVVNMHPLLRKNMSWAQQATSVKASIEKLVDKRFNRVSVIEENEELIIRIKKLPPLTY